MFGIGMPELILILVVALVIIGPKKLPDIANALGKGFAEFKKATDDIKSTVSMSDTKSEPVEKKTDETSQTPADKIPPPETTSDDDEENLPLP